MADPTEETLENSGAPDPDDSADPLRGRLVTSPWRMPWRGWCDVLLRVQDEAGRDNLALIAAGIAFYAMLSVTPALAVMISVYGLLVSPEELGEQMELLGNYLEYLPADAQSLIQGQMTELVDTTETSLGWGLIASATISLWSASKAMKSLFGGLNAVYDEEETRGWLWLALQSVSFTLAGILMMVLTLGTMAIVPLVLSFLPLSDFDQLLYRGLSALVVSVMVLAGLAMLYRYGPARSRAQWQWVTLGALVAWIAWVAVSAGLSWYVSNFDSFQKTYGALGAVAILLMWFYVSAYAILLGGELNAELEHQTTMDTTVGGTQPMGERGAVMADQIGPVPSWRKGGKKISKGANGP